MKTSYQILFSIELLHDYYNQQETFDDIQIIPTGKTQKSMNGYRILYKVSSNKLIALVQVDDTDKPFIKIGNDTSLRFLLKLKNPSFQNISALKTFDLNNNIYYFTNRADNEKGGILYLSRAIPVYKSGEDYEVGSLIQEASIVYEAVIQNIASPPPSNSWRILSQQRFPSYNSSNHSDIYKGTIVLDSVSSKNYEALKYIPQGQSIPVIDTIFWKEVSDLQYVTSEDLIDKNLIAVTKYEINHHADIYNGDILFNESDSKLYKALKFIGRGNSVSVADPNYWQEITAERFAVSNDSIDINENIFGVIDLFFNDSVPDNYSILDEGEVQEKSYTIRFKNRITTWKYISVNNTVTSLTDVNGIFSFTRSINEFISDSPIPLMLKPIQNFRLISESPASDTITVENLKCASAFIKPDNLTKSFSSEIFLNY